MAAAAPAPAHAPLLLKGFAEGFQIVNELAAHHVAQEAPLHVLMGRVRVEEAGDRLALLGTNIPGVGVGGVVVNRQALHCVDRASHRLSVLKRDILPRLRLHPKRGSYLLLRGFVAELRADAVAAGGGFNRQARDLALLLEAFANDADNLGPHAPYGGLPERVDGLVDAVNDLLHATCSVRQNAPPVEDAADQGQEAALEEAAAAAAAAAAEEEE